LRVRARTRLDIHSVIRVHGGVVVRGALMDASIEQPVGGRTVAISVDGEHGFYRYAEPTHPDGTFRWRVPLAVGQYTLRLAAGGDDDYGPPPPVVRALDVARRTPSLLLHVPDRFSVGERQLPIAVEAREYEGDVDVPLGLSTPVEGPNAGQLVPLPVVITIDGEPVARVRTGPGPLALTREVLPRQAGKRLQVAARFDGDDLRNPAQISRTVQLTTPTKLTMDASARELPWSGELLLAGELTDALGPVAAVPIAIVANGDEARPLATTTTDALGRYRARLVGGRAPARRAR
jgi:hypothetical protein